MISLHPVGRVHWCSCAHLLCGECIVIPDDSPDAGLGFRASEPESGVSVTQMSVTSTSQHEQSVSQDSLLPPGHPGRIR